jgi:hypothetical protein
MTGGRWRLLLVLAASSCAPTAVRVEADPPREVDWLAALLLGTDGAVLASTSLLPKGEGLSSQLASLSADLEEAGEVVVVGYRDADLRRANNGVPLSAEVASHFPLLAATAQDPALPKPFWSGGGARGAEAWVRLVPRVFEQDVWAGWMPACPILEPPGEEAILFPHCDQRFCGEFVQDGCRVRAELSCLREDRPEVLSVGPRGELRGGTGDFECSPAPPPEEAVFAFQCGSPTTLCMISAYRPPFSVPFELSEPIVLVPRARPDEPIDTSNRAATGFVTAIVARPGPIGGCRFGPRVVALTRNEARRCEGEHRLAVIDRDALTVIHEQVFPGCAIDLFADGDELWVVAAQPPALVRLDCDLEELSRHPISSTVALTLEVLAAEWVPRRGAPDEIWVGLGSPLFERTSPTGWIARINTDDPTQQTQIRLGPYPDGNKEISYGFGGHITTFAADRPVVTMYGLNDKMTHVLGAFDLTQSPPGLRTVVAKSGGGLPEVVESLAAIPSRGELLTSAPGAARPSVLRIGAPNGILTTEVGDYTRGETDFSAAHGWSAAPSPPGTVNYAIAVTTARRPARPESWIGMVDLERRRLLPGRTPIGYGPAGRIAEDDRGDLWVPLPWQGVVVRVHPSAPQLVRP